MLQTAALGDDRSEDAPQAGGIQGAAIALQQRVQDGGLASLIADRQTALALEPSDLGNGLGAAVDEAKKFEVKFVDHGALLLDGLHGIPPCSCCRKKTKAAILGSRPEKRV
jgi:hypothetical protein